MCVKSRPKALRSRYQNLLQWHIRPSEVATAIAVVRSSKFLQSKVVDNYTKEFESAQNQITLRTSDCTCTCCSDVRPEATDTQVLF